MGFIYKITNKITGKCYVGETNRDDPEKRWKQHVYTISKNKGCPALRDAVNKHGIENFKFEIIIICFDEDCFRYEKEYIQKYNSMVPNGYNILPGGIGGAGFKGKKHTEESIKKMVEACKKFREDNPNHFEIYREKLKESMKKVDTGSAVRNSEKWQKAKQEGRLGSRAHKNGKLSEETKDKIKQGVIKHYSQNQSLGKPNINIEKHRETMAKSVGRKIAQYSKENIFIKEYLSIASAGRDSGVKKANIQHVLSGNNLTAGGFIWKYVDEIELKEPSRSIVVEESTSGLTKVVNRTA